MNNKIKYGDNYLVKDCDCENSDISIQDGVIYCDKCRKEFKFVD